MNYYNEFDPFASAWLRELIKAKLIPEGEVDDRSIEDIKPKELQDYKQCHFFAGIGGWAYALQLANWHPDRPVWTGSCPCQPFSTAGKGEGFADPRHLWPVWYRLIRQCKPDVIFGEQVEAGIRHGWLDLVSSDLESQDYAFGSVVLGAHSVGSPHRRQRLYWVADAQDRRERTSIGRQGALQLIDHNFPTGKLAKSERQRRRGRNKEDGEGQELPIQVERPGTTNFWSSSEWLSFQDGKSRPVEPGTFPLAYGIPKRVGKLRGYGNAIVPQTAAEFIKAYLALHTVIRSNETKKAILEAKVNRLKQVAKMTDLKPQD